MGLHGQQPPDPQSECEMVLFHPKINVLISAQSPPKFLFSSRISQQIHDFYCSLLPWIYFRSPVSSLSTKPIAFVIILLYGLVLRSVCCWHGLFLALLTKPCHCFSLLLCNISKDIVSFSGETAVDIELLVLLWFVLVPHFPQKLKVACISVPHVTQKETILNYHERVAWAAITYECWVFYFSLALEFIALF